MDVFRETTPSRWDRGDTLGVAAIVLLGAIVRLIYVNGLGLSQFDPWRHVLLVRNLREGLGFTLFDGQPYIWYQPPWYWLCAAFPEAVAPVHIASFLSLLGVPLLYGILRVSEHDPSRLQAVIGGLLMAAFGPLVRYTCHSGPEAFALLLLLAAVAVVQVRREWFFHLLAGLLLGVGLVARMNFVFNVFLFLPCLTRWRRAVALAAGAAVPLLAAWFRNHLVIRDHAWLFTWDGLATPTRDFNLVSTLLIQMHPDVNEGLRRLHAQIVAEPEWLASFPWLTFLLVAVVSLAVAGRWTVRLVVLSAVFYFLLLDSTSSSNFFRIWVGLFPAMFMGIAAAARWSASAPGQVGRVVGASLVILVLLLGAPSLAPSRMSADDLLELATAPPSLLTRERYLVNSTFYHPESLAYRFPDRQFVGMPLHPEDFDDFQRHFERYDTVLWHPFSIQDELKHWLTESGRFVASDSAPNRMGRVYRVFVEREPQPSGVAESE